MTENTANRNSQCRITEEKEERGIHISWRLQAIAQLVTPGVVLADVGTDHGYLPIWLVQQGRISRAIAMDINTGPLLRAQESICACGLEDKIETRQSDGLDKLDTGEVQSIVIAGMGGELIMRILESEPEKAKAATELILSPHTKAGALRTFLWRAGYTIQLEQIVLDEGKYYVIIKAAYAGAEVRIPDEQECERYADYGRLLDAGDPTVAAWLDREEKSRRDILKKLMSGDSADAQEKIRQIEIQLSRIREARGPRG